MPTIGLMLPLILALLVTSINSIIMLASKRESAKYTSTQIDERVWAAISDIRSVLQRLDVENVELRARLNVALRKRHRSGPWTSSEARVQSTDSHPNSAGSSDELLIHQIHALPDSNETRVISFGLYGDNPKYTQGAIENAKLVDTYYSGWIARFYVDDTVPPQVLDRLEGLQAEVINVRTMQGGNTAPLEGATAGMFWRFMVADDPEVDRYIVRDTDSRLNARERFAVEEWIRSNRSTHCMRDHPWHYDPMLGGMWGSVKGAIKNMTQLIGSWEARDHYKDDMEFLATMVWPLVRGDHVAHDSYYCKQFPHTRAFPTQRNLNFQHVGQVHDDGNGLNPIHIEMLRERESPLACRRHPEWKFG